MALTAKMVQHITRSITQSNVGVFRSNPIAIIDNVLYLLYDAIGVAMSGGVLRISKIWQSCEIVNFECKFSAGDIYRVSGLSGYYSGKFYDSLKIWFSESFFRKTKIAHMSLSHNRDRESELPTIKIKDPEVGAIFQIYGRMLFTLD